MNSTDLEINFLGKSFNSESPQTNYGDLWETGVFLCVGTSERDSYSINEFQKLIETTHRCPACCNSVL